VHGRRKAMNEKNAFFSFIAFLLSSSVIQFMLLLKLTDHMFPVKLVIGSQVSSFSRGKSRHPMRNSGPFFGLRLSFTSRRKILSAYFLISQRGSCRPGVACDYSITDLPIVG
jgi:hypothetical protein